MKGIPTNEQETTIQFDRDGNKARIWTSDTTVMTKLDRLVKDSDLWESTDIVTADDIAFVIAKEYRCPKEMITFRSKKVTGRKMSEEHKQKLVEGARLYRENRTLTTSEDN